MTNSGQCVNLGKADSLFNLTGCSKNYSKNLRRRLLPKVYAEESEWYDGDGNINTYCAEARNVVKSPVNNFNQQLPLQKPPSVPLNGFLSENRVVRLSGGAGFGRYTNGNVPTNNYNRSNIEKSKSPARGNQRNNENDSINYVNYNDKHTKSDSVEEVPIGPSKAHNVTYWYTANDPQVISENGMTFLNPSPPLVPVIQSSNPAFAVPVTMAKTFTEQLHVHYQKLKDEIRVNKDFLKQQIDILDAQQDQLEREEQDLYRMEIACQQYAESSPSDHGIGTTLAQGDIDMNTRRRNI